MVRSVVHTDNAPKAVGPYSQGIACNGLVFLSGQIPIDKSTGEIVQGGITDQMHVCMKNLAAVLDAAGSSVGNILKTTIFITDMAYFQEVNAVYTQYFEGSPPARSCVAVSALPKGANVEVEAIAAKI